MHWVQYTEPLVADPIPPNAVYRAKLRNDALLDPTEIDSGFADSKLLIYRMDGTEVKDLQPVLKAQITSTEIVQASYIKY